MDREQAIGDPMLGVNDDRRPGLGARDIQQLARDLMLARDVEAGRKALAAIRSTDEPLDLGEMHGRRGRAIFLIGAGCSATAGIPLASEVAKECASLLARRYSPPRRTIKSTANPEAALRKLVDQKVVPRRFVQSSRGPNWGELYKYFFAEHLKSPNQQREVISRIIKNKELSLNWGHACLGALVARRYVHTILTTNFDQLVLQGIIRTGLTPVVADGLESLMRISPSPALPQVVHLHGSMHTYDLRNSPTALSETESDKNLQTMMMSLLKQSTILVVVGYSGGEEGIMGLLQYAAENIPRMVIYWVAYEKSFADFSPRARALLETGENKFFIPGQDSDRFFQRLMRDLGEGQPDWVADPIKLLVQQGEQLEAGNDPEIADLIDHYRRQTDHAQNHRLPGGDAVVTALQARSEGDFKAAIRTLEPLKDGDNRHAKKLYAQSLQDEFDAGLGKDRKLIDAAVEEFWSLFRSGRGRPRLEDAKHLIEALFDRVETSEDEQAEKVIGLTEIIEVVHAAKDSSTDPAQTHSLLDFYEAQAMQELKSLDDDRRPDRALIEAYLKATTDLAALGDKSLEARDGLAQALVTYAEDYLKAKPDPSREERRQIRDDINRAIAIHTELVEWSWYNQPDPTFAAYLENLASDYEVLARVRREGPMSDMPLREAARSLERAISAYNASGDTDRASVAETRLADLRERMRG